MASEAFLGVFNLVYESKCSGDFFQIVIFSGCSGEIDCRIWWGMVALFQGHHSPVGSMPVVDRSKLSILDF